MNSDFQKQLNAIVKQKNPLTNSQPAPFAMPSFSMPSIPSFSSYSEPTSIIESVKSNSVARNAIIVLMSVFVVVVVLVFVNIFIYPVFPSWLVTTTVPGMDDVTIFWQTQPSVSTIPQVQSVIGAISRTYTILVDIQIDNPQSYLNMPRVFLVRGPAQSTFLNNITSYLSETGSIGSLFPDPCNLVMHVDPKTTDLYVSVSTIGNNGTGYENIWLPNIPVQTSLRMGIVVMPNLMEVYMNGSLVKTLKYVGEMNDIKGDIRPPVWYPIAESSPTPFGRIQNLRVWNRILGPAEIKNYGAGSPFEVIGQGDSATCNR
jgi:hypothetical protein